MIKLGHFLFDFHQKHGRISYVVDIFMRMTTEDLHNNNHNTNELDLYSTFLLKEALQWSKHKGNVHLCWL